MNHPIVEQVAPSDEQAPAVFAMGQDVVVNAGAGAGKTRTLVARYLRLLADGLSPRSVVAITFTKKAAREMRNRVRDELRRYLQRTDLDPEERERWLELYSQLDAARIDTIHSLCAEILRTHPAEAGVDPQFEMLEEGASLLRSEAVVQTMAWAADNPETVGLFSLLGESKLRETLDSLVARRLEVTDTFKGLPENLWTTWQTLLVPLIRDFVDDPGVHADFAELLKLRANGSIDRAEALGDGLPESLRPLLSIWDSILAARVGENWASISSQLAPLRKLMKQVGKAANWKPADPKGIIGELQGVYDARLGEWVGKGINLDLDQQLAQAYPKMRDLFDYGEKVYGQLKETRQGLDFDDLEQGALALLEGCPDVRSYWQTAVQAVLVDEFQDTNDRQRRLVRALCDQAGKLFIVGDAKQSIYRFRGADVTVFRRERERIQDQNGAVVLLETSYRAHRDLVGGLNDLLKPILGEETDGRPWAEPFAALKHSREEASPGFIAPHIEFHLTAGSKASGALDRAADALAARLAGMVDGGTVKIREGDTYRPLHYGDVAILCRASTSFEAYEDAFERAGIPFLTVSGRGFYGRPEIRDLLNALRALADPTDSLALAGFLRSPALALSDEALYRLCERRQATDAQVTLWDALQTVGPTLPGDDHLRSSRAITLIIQLHDLAGRVTVAELLKALLDATDYRAVMVAAGQGRGVRNVAKLLSDAHSSGMVSVGEFLEYVQALRDSGTREGEARALAERAVQIMTIHAAKGLEFPVVVIGDVSHRMPGRNEMLIAPDLGVLLPVEDDAEAMPGVYRLAKLRDQDQEAAESDRLLYVAATRARESLMLSGCLSLTKDNKVGACGGWLDRLAAPEVLGLKGQQIPYDEAGAQTRLLGLQAGATQIACAIYEPGFVHPSRTRVVPDSGSYLSTLQFERLNPLTAQTEPGGQSKQLQERPQRVWRVVPPVEHPRAPAWVVGSLVHAALAAWRFPDDGFAAWIEAEARGYGITDGRQLDDAVGQARRMLTRFQESQLYGELVSADRRLHEMPYSVIVDGRVESRIIDLIYLRRGSWTIVEFKTDRIADEAELREMLIGGDYLDQAHQYMSAIEGFLRQPPRAVICLLNFAGGVQLYPVA